MPEIAKKENHATESQHELEFSERAASGPGNLIVVTGPSGVGKGTLTQKLLATVPYLVKSVSVTTRAQRPGEVEGVDYFYLTREKFTALQEQGKLMENAEFAGNFYGTPQDWVDEQLALGLDVLLEIEVQGARQIRDKRPQSLLIFLSPPDYQSLKNRLEGRATETPEKIAARLRKAQDEMKQRHLFHYEVINDDLDAAVTNLVHIVYAERCRIRNKNSVSK